VLDSHSGRKNRKRGNPSSTVFPGSKVLGPVRSGIEHEHDGGRDRPEGRLNFWDASPCLLSAALKFDLSLSRLEEGIPRIFLFSNRARSAFGAGKTANGGILRPRYSLVQKCLGQSGQESTKSTMEEGTDPKGY
jgi:hypothetical protein